MEAININWVFFINKNKSLSNKYIIACLIPINERRYGKRRPNNRLSYAKFEELHGFIIEVLWKVIKINC